MEKIDISKLSGNQVFDYDEEEPKYYEDIEILANKINEIIDFLTTPQE